jgi:DNA-binding CsgD family transcriptional regulator
MTLGRALDIDTRDDLIQGALRAPDLERFAQTVIHYVREAMPPSGRNPTSMRTLRAELFESLEVLFFTSGGIDDRASADVPNHLSPRNGASAEEQLLATLHAAGNLLDRTLEASRDGTLLRSAAPMLVDIARILAERRHCDVLVRTARDLEGLGAAPSVCYLANGQPIWVNSAVERLAGAREYEIDQFLGEVNRYATAVCKDVRNNGKHLPADGRVPEPRLYLRAKVDSDGMIGGTRVTVTLSEALREPELSPRELEVVQNVARLGSYKAVAEKLGISLDSVRTHIRRAYRKLGVGDRVTLVARLKRDGKL